MGATVRLTNATSAPRPTCSARRFVLSALVLGFGCLISSSVLFIGSVGSPAYAQPADAAKLQLRAKIKSAAEELNGIASAAPDMIRAMFAGTVPSANLLALDEKSIAAQAQLESAILAANEGGALSADETKELARLGDTARKTRDPVKADIETLKTVIALPVVGGDTAVRLAPQSQQDAVLKNAEEAKVAVGALVAAIQKLP